MFWVRFFYTRLKGLLRKDKVEAEMDAELRLHMMLRTQENLARGMTPEEARRDAQRRFGNLDHIKDLCRDIRGGGGMETLWQDVRFGLRMLRKKPGFTLIAVITLGLGIGANTAIFSVVNAVLLRPLAYHEPERVVTLLHQGQQPVSPANFLDLRANSQSFEQMAAAEAWSGALNLPPFCRH